MYNLKMYLNNYPYTHDAIVILGRKKRQSQVPILLPTGEAHLCMHVAQLSNPPTNYNL